MTNKVIWITGASSGIGEALSYQLSKRDVKLIISARRKEELERVKERCEGSPEDIKVLPLDLAESSSMPEKVSDALAYFGHVDLLINNGGISQRSLIMDTTLEVDRRVMEVNYFGTVSLTKALLSSMIERQSGHIVVVTSAVGIVTTRFRSGYAAAKHALHGFFDTLRIEHYDDNIDVTLILPGFIHTDVSKNALTGNGNPQNTTDETTAGGMTPDACAIAMIRSIEKKKEEVYITGFKEKSAIYLKRWWPTLFSKMIKKAKVS
ncbi:MAG: SDR family oxidoreductase [Cytophagales bacterium]|nr:SDR family oxidoreductase [Cytophagales bacterium]